MNTPDVAPAAAATQTIDSTAAWCSSYDAAGNRIARTDIATGQVTLYVWNNASELTAVISGDTKVVYAYDALGRMVSRTPTGIAGEQTEYYVYDGQNLALVLNAAGQVVERELYAPAVDQILATETVPPGAAPQVAGTVNWNLTDNQGTVRDVVQFNGSTTVNADHLVYDSSGQITSQTPGATQPTFTYDGMWQDPATGLNKTATRWYDAVDSVFMSQDPISFLSGQTNLSEFCGNSPTNHTDPSGEAWWNPLTWPGAVHNAAVETTNGGIQQVYDQVKPQDAYMAKNNFVSAMNSVGADEGCSPVHGQYNQTCVEQGSYDPAEEAYQAYLESLKSPHPPVGVQGPPSGGGTPIPVRAPMTAEELGNYRIANGLIPKIWKAPSGGEAFVTSVEAGATAACIADGLADAVAEGIAGAGWGEATNLLKQCFPAGTLVATPSGLLPIESIKVGDSVWAYDLVRSQWVARHVLQRFITDHEGTSATITVADEEIEATFLHPFWVVRGEDLASRPVRGHLPAVPEGATTAGRWVDAGDIRAGDDLLLRDGRIMSVQATRHQPYCDKVYNIHVDDLECYAVGQNCVLVHNTNGAPEDIGPLKDRWMQEREGAEQIANEMRDLGASESQIARWLQAAYDRAKDRLLRGFDDSCPPPFPPPW